MGRTLRLRKGPRIPQFEEALARLSDELSLTENFTTAMVRDGDYAAALRVIDEQRERLQKAESHMLAAFRPAGRRRMQVALGGIAAVMLLGSASFAMISGRSNDANTAPAIIERAQEKIAQAADATSEAQVAGFLDGAIAELSTLNGTAPDSQINNEDVRGLELMIKELIAKRPYMSQLLVRRLVKIKAQVTVHVPDADIPTPTPTPSAKAQEPKAEPKTDGSSASPAPSPSAEQPNPLDG